MPGRDVKHQGASEPSGFRQKFSRRSLGRRSAQRRWFPACLQLEPSLRLRPRPRLPSSPARDHAPQVPPAGEIPQRQPTTSLARVFLGRKAMLMRALCVPALAGHACRGGVGRAPVALALPAEASERRGFVARLCLGPLDGPWWVGARSEAETPAGAGAEPHSRGSPAGSRPACPFSPAMPRPPRFPGASRAGSSRPTAAREVAEFSLHLRVRGIAPGPL